MSPRPTRSARSIIAQIEKSYKKSVRLLEESMVGLETTSHAYLQRVLALAKLHQSHREELAARGVVPTNLGTATKVSYEFRATVDTPSAQPDAERQKFELEMDLEYPDATQAPAPTAPAKKLTKKRSK